MCAAGLEPGPVPPGQSRRDFVRRRRKGAQSGILTRQVVDSTGKLADGASPGVSAKGQIHGITWAKIDEVGWSENGPWAPLAHPRQQLRVHGGGLLARGFDRNIAPLSVGQATLSEVDPPHLPDDLRYS